MTDVSPSSKKVDDFLSTLSKLSQEKLLEDQKRQRELQRNIQELSKYKKSTSTKSQPDPIYSKYDYHEVPELKFNRSNTKDTPPPLPSRKYKDKKIDFEIELLNPIGRKNETSNIDTTTRSVKKPNLIEETKRQPPTKPKKLELYNEPKAPSPRTPQKADWLSSLSTSKSTTSTPQSKTNNTTIKSPSRSDWMTSLSTSKSTTSTPQTIAKSNTLSKVKSNETSNKKHPPPKPKKNLFETKEESEFKEKFKSLRSASQSPEKHIRKPTNTESIRPNDKVEFLSKFENLKSISKTKTDLHDNPPLDFQQNFEKIKKRSPPKKPEKKLDINSYKDKDAEELKNQMKKLGKSPTKEVDVDYETQDSKELKNQMEKLRSSTTSNKLQPITKNEPEELSFQNRLGNILAKSSTFPKPNPTRLQRTSTEPKIKKQDQKSTEKLVHATKSRSKGPKRRLPKTLQKSTNSKTNEKELSQSISPSSHSSTAEIQVKKKPPPINKLSKPKEIGELRPRNVSGELFI